MLCLISREARQGIPCKTNDVIRWEWSDISQQQSRLLLPTLVQHWYNIGTALANGVQDACVVIDPIHPPPLHDPRVIPLEM